MGAYDLDTFYVETYRLEYSNNGLTWEKYRENGQVKVSSASGGTCYLHQSFQSGGKV